MTSTDVNIIVVDPANIKAADAKELPVRDGDEPWTTSELRDIVKTLNSDVERLVAEFHATETELDDLLHTVARGLLEPLDLQLALLGRLVVIELFRLEVEVRCENLLHQ